MKRTPIGRRSIEDYRSIVGDGVIADLRTLARPLRGKKILHVNATPVGGGVAEILKSKIPLLRSLGIDAEWRTLDAVDEFFAITKKMHNGLQSAEVAISDEEWSLYFAQSEQNAATLPQADLVVVHDPQPMAIAGVVPERADAWIWRLHVDSSTPNASVWRTLTQLLSPYALAIFTLEQFAPPDVPGEKRRVIAPAIDPRATKNLPMPIYTAIERVRSIGIDPGRPLFSQVARLDVWKDPWGVIDAYRMIKRDGADIQLALLGVIEAVDDPEAFKVYEQVKTYAGEDPDIHIFVDPGVVGDLEVSAVQTLSQIVFQKSTREGFGLSVTEALWKATPVIGGLAGGIPLQIKPDVGGYLVASAEEAAERAAELLDDPPKSRVLAANGRMHVKANFLITRLIREELELYLEALAL